MTREAPDTIRDLRLKDLGGLGPRTIRDGSSLIENGSPVKERQTGKYLLFS